MKSLFLCFTFFLCFGCSQKSISQSSTIKKQTFEYAIVEGDTLKLDVYQNKQEGLKPVMIWMHGGGFAVGARDFGVDADFMNILAEHGYLAVSISYRLLRKGEETGFGCDCPAETKRTVFREAAKDFWKAVAYVYDHAEEWQIDTNQIIVGGSSAGAEGVANAIYMRDWVFEDHESEEYKQSQNIPIAGLLSLAGAIVDQRYITEETAVPGIFYHGVHDQLVPYGTAPHHYCDPNRKGHIWLDGAATITDKLEEYNSAYILASYPEGKHEISSIPFGEMDELLNWMDRLFIKKEKLQLVIEKYRE